MWPVVEYDLLHNVTDISFRPENGAPLVTSFLNVLGYWPQMFFLSSFLVVSTLQGIIPLSKLVDSMSVFCGCYLTSFSLLQVCLQAGTELA